MILSVFHTHLRVDVETVGLLFVSQTAMLNNNQWHTVSLTFMPDALSDNSTITELVIDGVRDSHVIEKFDIPVLRVGDPLFIGGATDELSAIVTESFLGCIREVFINNRYFTSMLLYSDRNSDCFFLVGLCLLPKPVN